MSKKKKEKRSPEVVSQEYINACAKYGDLTYQAKLALDAMRSLDAEWKTLQAPGKPLQQGEKK